MTPPDLDELLLSDLREWVNRHDLGDALEGAGRHEEADLCWDLLLPVRVVDGRVVEG